MGLVNGWDAGFDAAQGFAVEDPFPAGWALVEFEVGDGVGLSLELAGPCPADFLDFIATASWAKSDFLHILFGRDGMRRRLQKNWGGGSGVQGVHS